MFSNFFGSFSNMGNESSVQVEARQVKDRGRPEFEEPTKFKVSKPAKPSRKSKPMKPTKAEATQTTQKPCNFPIDSNILVLDAGSSEANGVYTPWTKDSTGHPRWRHQEDINEFPENTRQIAWSPSHLSPTDGIWCIWGSSDKSLYQFDSSVWACQAGHAPVPLVQPTTIPGPVHSETVHSDPWDDERRVVDTRKRRKPSHEIREIRIGRDDADQQGSKGYPAGDWFARAKEIKIKGNRISALLLDNEGQWVNSEIEYHPESYLVNVGGKFVEKNPKVQATADADAMAEDPQKPPKTRFYKSQRVKVYSQSVDQWYHDGIVTACDEEEVTVHYNRVNTILMMEQGIISTKSLEVDSADIAPLGQMPMYTPDGEVSTEMKSALLDIFVQYQNKDRTEGPKGQMGWTQWEKYWQRTYNEHNVDNLLKVTEDRLGKRTATAQEFLRFYVGIAHDRVDVCIDDLLAHGFSFINTDESRRRKFENKYEQNELECFKWKAVELKDTPKIEKQTRRVGITKKGLPESLVGKNVKDWACPDVATFLFSLGDEPGWKQYAALACTDSIDGLTIMDCEAADLVDIGFVAEHAERVVKALKAVKKWNSDGPKKVTFIDQTEAPPPKQQQSIESQRKQIQQEVLLEQERVETTRDVFLIDHQKYRERMHGCFQDFEASMSAEFDRAIADLQTAKKDMLKQFGEFQRSQDQALTENADIIKNSFHQLNTDNNKFYENLSNRLEEINAKGECFDRLMKENVESANLKRGALKKEFSPPQDVNSSALKTQLLKLSSSLKEFVSSWKKEGQDIIATIYSTFTTATNNSFTKGGKPFQPPIIQSIYPGDSSVSVVLGLPEGQEGARITATLERRGSAESVSKSRDGAGQIVFDSLVNGAGYRVVAFCAPKHTVETKKLSDDGRLLTSTTESTYVVPRGVPGKPILTVLEQGQNSVTIEVSSTEHNGSPITSVTVALSSGAKKTCTATGVITFDGLSMTEYSAAAVAFNAAGASPASEKLRFCCQWPSGVQINFSAKQLKGIAAKYEAPYSDCTRSFDMESLIKPGTDPWVFVGAKDKSEEKIYVGAFGRASRVLRKTTSLARAEEHNGVYWYWRSRDCFGFADTADVKLSSHYDSHSPTSDKRLSWQINRGKGGVRAGKHRTLTKSQRWTKCFYVMKH